MHKTPRKRDVSHAVFATLAVLAALLAPGTTPACAQGTQLLVNRGLDDPYKALPAPTGKAKVSGAIAQGWVDDSSWADVTAVYGKAKTGVHGGSAAQSITVKAVRVGAVQFAQWLSLTPGHSYALSVWLKGPAGAHTTVGLRLAPPPYTMLGQAKVTLTGAWQRVKVSAAAHGASRGGFMIYPPTGATLAVDDASLTDVTKK